MGRHVPVSFRRRVLEHRRGRRRSIPNPKPRRILSLIEISHVSIERGADVVEMVTAEPFQKRLRENK